MSFALFSSLLACSSASDEAAQKTALPPLPASCSALPRFADVQGRAVAEQAEVLRARTATVIIARDATDFPNYATDYALLGADPKSLRETAKVFANAADVPRSDLSGKVDFATESLLVHSAFDAVADYTYAVAGDTLLVLVQRAEPCLDDARAKSFGSGLASASMRVLRVPKVARVEIVSVGDERFYQPLPEADGSCRSLETPVFTGGGDAAFADGSGATATPRLFVNGFSAMTGNVFAITAKDDGSTFSPNSWDQNALGRFDDRSAYADVYSPFVENLGDRYRLTARLRDLSSPTSSTITEYTSTDGVHWGKGTPLLRGNFGAPARALGDDRMVVTRERSIVWAERGGDGWKVGDSVALSPAPGTYYDYGVGDAEVRDVGGRQFMYFTAFSGGPSALFTSIGVADAQPDGSFRPRAKPVLIPSREDELGGVSAPAIAVRGDAVWLYYTAVNANAEPVVRRAICTAP
ncbi:MAG: hypothetical protein HOO96_11475 [Polyangiaceae bacterium]|nr:hypothetical protein [Polyangiaceae bacterium]